MAPLIAQLLVNVTSLCQCQLCRAVLLCLASTPRASVVCGPKHQSPALSRPPFRAAAGRASRLDLPRRSCRTSWPRGTEHTPLRCCQTRWPSALAGSTWCGWGGCKLEQALKKAAPSSSRISPHAFLVVQHVSLRNLWRPSARAVMSAATPSLASPYAPKTMGLTSPGRSVPCTAESRQLCQPEAWRLPLSPAV